MALFSGKELVGQQKRGGVSIKPRHRVVVDHRDVAHEGSGHKKIASRDQKSQHSDQRLHTPGN